MALIAVAMWLWRIQNLDIVAGIAVVGCFLNHACRCVKKKIVEVLGDIILIGCVILLLVKLSVRQFSKRERCLCC